MDSKRWNKIKAVFAEAVELPKEAQSQFLEESCEGDPEVHNEVLALLAAEETVSGDVSLAIEREARLAADSLAREVAPAANPGSQFGPYRLVRELGRGGMGSVYLAIRTDDEFQREVAIKVVRNLTPDLLERFRDERQILADLNHPGIARLLDGSTTQEGLPYLVMEYIDGLPIDRYCNEKRLPVKERLRLFLNVCEAVEFAHRNLVVHRDIKPSNILVTADGQIKLLDFGIAKMLRAAEGEGQGLASSTQTGTKLMTPEYASPEQVRGGSITTATDVYALGVLLYRLLTGKPPYVAEDESIGALQIAICGTTPEMPSREVMRQGDASAAGHVKHESIAALRGTSAERLRRELAGDLDQIVLTALRKEPERRYLSVALFAQDIRSHLEGRTVSARGDTWSYRTGTLLRRHPFASSFAAIFLLTVSLLSVALLIQVQRLSRQRDIAAQQTQKAEETIAFFLNLFRLADPGETRGNEITAREILDQGSTRVRSELAGQPAVQAAMMESIAQVYQNLGLRDRAALLLEDSLKVRKAYAGTRNKAYAGTLTQLGLNRLEQGRYKDARRLLSDAVEIARDVTGTESASYGSSLLALIRLNAMELRLDEALSAFPQCIALHRKLYGEDSLELAAALNEYGLALYDKKDYKHAESIQREALAIRQKRLDLYHPDVSESLNNLAIILTDSGQFTEAEPISEQALTVDRKIYGQNHSYVGTDLNNLAMLHQFRGDFEKAEALHREALGVREIVVGKDHPEYAVSLANISKAQLGLKNYTEAEASQRQAISIYNKVYGHKNPRVAAAYNMLGAIFSSQGRFEDARLAYLDALQLYEGMTQNHDNRKAETLEGLGRVLLRQGQFADAEKSFRESLELSGTYLEDNHWRSAWVRILLADSLANQSKWAEAKELVEPAEAIVRKVRGEEGIEWRTAQRVLSQIAAHVEIP